MIPRPPSSTLFPYTTLFRSATSGVRSASMGSALERIQVVGQSGVVGQYAALPHDLDAFKRSEEHTSELQSRRDLVCRLLLEKKKNETTTPETHEHSYPARIL